MQLAFWQPPAKPPGKQAKQINNSSCVEGSTVKLLVLPGDGIGPEITNAAIDVLRAVEAVHNITFDFDVEDIGLTTLSRDGTTLPERVVEKVPQADGVILGPVSHFEYPSREQGGINPSGELRKVFELYSNVRPCRSRPDLSILREPMDLVIVRENTEGFYADRNMLVGPGEFMPDSESAFSLRKVTVNAVERVSRMAFEMASTRKRKVTAVHKANVLRISDGLFLKTVRRVAEEYPDIELEELIVDAAAAHLIRRPQSFDVLVTTNMFGDILSDEASELSGSLGLAGSLNVGADVAVAQAQHGSAPDIAGQSVANPTSLILSAAMLLDWRGRKDQDESLVAAANHIEAAVESVLSQADSRTRDLGGTLSTEEFTREVVSALEQS
jgi:3-isopropylmalate dehydrogenase